MKMIFIVLVMAFASSTFAEKLGVATLSLMDADDEITVRGSKCGYSDIKLKNTGGSRTKSGDRMAARINVFFVNYHFENSHGEIIRRRFRKAPGAMSDDFLRGEDSRWYEIADGREVCIDRVRVEGTPRNLDQDKERGNVKVTVYIR